MMDRIFTVEELAQLCEVDRETIRRWRNKGVRGVCLEATDSTVLRGKPISFTADAIRRFARVNPKIMTPALREALNESASEPVSTGWSVRSSAADAERIAAITADDEDFLRQVLQEKRTTILMEMDEMRRALEQTERALKRLGGKE